MRGRHEGPSTVDALYGVWAAWERRGRRKAKSQTSQGPDYWAAKASSLRAALDPHLARMFDAAMALCDAFRRVDESRS